MKKRKNEMTKAHAGRRTLDTQSQNVNNHQFGRLSNSSVQLLNSNNCVNLFILHVQSSSVANVIRKMIFCTEYFELIALQ